MLCFLVFYSGCERIEDYCNQDIFATITTPSIVSNAYTSIIAIRKDASALITLRYFDPDIFYKLTDNFEYPDYYEVYLSRNACDNWEMIRTLDNSYINNSFTITGLTNNELYYVYLKEITGKGKVVKNTNVVLFIPSECKPTYSFIMKDYYDHDLYSFDRNSINNEIVYATMFYEYQPDRAAPSIFISESDNEPHLVDVNCWFPDINNNGTKISYSSDKGEVFDGNLMPEHIAIYDINIKKITRMTSGYSVNKYPVWSPDNSKLAFLTDLNGKLQIWIYDFKNKSSLLSSSDRCTFVPKNFPGTLKMMADPGYKNL